MSNDKPYVSPLEIHNEQAHLIPMRRPPTKNAAVPMGGEIACLVGGVDDEPIPALFHPSTRTVYPVRDGE